MIKLLTQDKTDEFISLCKSTVLGSVILTKLFAYGINSPIQYFWYEETGGRMVSVLNLDGGLMSISKKGSNSAELHEFTKMLGCKSVYTDFSPGFGEKNIKRGEILIYSPNAETPEAIDIDSENIKKIFPVIYENSEEAEREIIFNTWYPDISLKKRRGLIRAKGIAYGDKLVSCAVTCAENENCAVITGVATLSKYRRRGFAQKCVVALSNELHDEEKSVYLITDNEETKKWYEKMGFKHFSYRYAYSI